ncbi:MAG: hypothetical protein V4733_01235 [Verrucomicrobiota bacterium]
MKFLATLAAAAISVSAASAETPKVFAGLLTPDVPVRAQIGMVVPPKEMDKYIAKVEASARKNREWFKEFSAKSKPGIPLPFDERLGLSKQEYDEYLVLWAKREFKSSQDVMIVLRETPSGEFSFTATGDAAILSTLRLDPKTGDFRSPNGTLKRIEDLKAEPTSLLGEWAGAEWKFEEETGIGKIKENFAIGKFADNKFGIIVYRAQEISSSGSRTLDKSLVIRFALGPAGILKPRPAVRPKGTAKPDSKR